GADNDGIQSYGDVVRGVGLHFLLPHDLGNDAEESSSVEAINAVRDGGKIKVAKRQAVHASASCFRRFIRHDFIFPPLYFAPSDLGTAVYFFVRRGPPPP